MITLQLSEIATILTVKKPTQDATIQGVSSDTRTLSKGNLYIAIRGEQFDGHDFIKEAMQKGAAAAIVSRAIDSPLPQIIVNDTIEALGKLAANWRERFSLPLIGVTGSNGKTTLKNMIASILRAACHNDATQALATEGNLNNNIGLPLNLLRLNQSHRYAVLEMGLNHFGEMAYLSNIAKPTVAAINNAASAHLEGLEDVAGVARAKGEIFTALNKKGTAILNRDDAFFDYWKTLLNGQQIISFGFDASANVTAQFGENQQTTIITPKGNITIKLPLLGRHNVMNALAAAAATLAVGIDLNAIKMGLENVTPAPGRLRQHQLKNNLRIIDDTYNANPASVNAAINTLATIGGTKILILGDMRELGPEASALHFSIGQSAKSAGIHHLFTFGELSQQATKAFGNHAQHFTDRDTLVQAVQPYLAENTTILVKGSRSMHMEKIIAQLVPEASTDHAH
ncbi:hypothetical protein AYO45_04495 [Gammaproteobacteria bacterium SCGC AG-212-F23]|nr:hypothetical protein AYO45_04495 [Gammaproteobacteria bacterium SCGC AG-212-F23]